MQESGLRKEIGQLGFGAIALNGTIGAGIFALPAIAVERAGLFSPWIYVACGILIMAIVFVFARVASYFTDTGGPVTYATTAFDPFAGFQAGWLLTLSRATAFAANAHLMVTYAGWFWPPLADGTWHMLAVGFVCVLLTVINLVGVRQGMLAIFALTVLKLLPLLLLVFLGISQTNPEIFAGAEIPPLDSLGETMLIVFYAFVGRRPRDICGLKVYDSLPDIWHKRPFNKPGLRLGVLIQTDNTAVLELKYRIFNGPCCEK